MCDDFTNSLDFIYCSKVGSNKRGSVKVLNPIVLKIYFVCRYLDFSSTILTYGYTFAILFFTLISLQTSNSNRLVCKY